MKIAWMLMSVATVAMMASCSRPSPTLAPQSISEAHLASDPPRLAVEYTAKISHGLTIKVKMDTFLDQRMNTSEIDQSDGKWILFDIDSPADKILDRDILPEVLAVCSEIKRRDKVYVDSNPSDYVDTSGTHWHRQ